MNLQEAGTSLRQSLTTIYEPREASNIADWVMEKLTGLNKLDRLIKKSQPLDDMQLGLFNEYVSALLDHKPVQYVLGEAPFYRVNFYVNKHVLIPRPETEELVEWMLHTTKENASVLDIGTGSGCIAISIKLNKPSCEVSACDISEAALEIARTNMNSLKAPVTLVRCNILDESEYGTLGDYDVIISNPPYIPESDKDSMHSNVLLHEPHLALFTGDDAFVFYRAITKFAQTHLTVNGSIFFEIHETGDKEVIDILHEAGFNHTELKHDLYGKARMIRATR